MKRQSFVLRATCSGNQTLPENWEERQDAFEARVARRRVRPDGTDIPPEDIFAVDQSPVTREITARRYAHAHASARPPTLTPLLLPFLPPHKYPCRYGAHL